MEVKKSTWAERDCRPLSNSTHQYHTAILEKAEHMLRARGDANICTVEKKAVFQQMFGCLLCRNAYEWWKECFHLRIII